MKSKRASQILSVIKPINKMTPKKRKQFIACCNRETLNCLCECAKNILRGNIKLSRSQLSKLKKHKSAIRNITLKKTPLYTKRKLLQRGGFISALIGPAISLLTSLFTRNQ